VWSPTELAAWQAMASAEEAADCLAGVAVTIAVAELGGAPPLAASRRRTREGGVEANRQGPNFACQSIFIGLYRGHSSLWMDLTGESTRGPLFCGEISSPRMA